MDSKVMGTAVSSIRKGKKIPVKVITACGISESQFFRFVKGESSLKVESFIKLIDQLNVTIDEFLYIARDYKIDPYKLFFKEIENSFYENNTTSLYEISEIALESFKKTHIEKFRHISAVALILKSRLEKQPIPILEFNLIRDYIYNLSLWSHYDLSLFINVMFAFNIEETRYLITRIKRDENKFSGLMSNVAEQFRLLFNLIIMDLEHKNMTRLHEDICEIRSIKLEENFVLEHILLHYIVQLESYIFGEDSIESLTTIQKDLEKYGIYSYANVIKNINMFISHIE